jgi:hypothetical protein
MLRKIITFPRTNLLQNGTTLSRCRCFETRKWIGFIIENHYLNRSKPCSRLYLGHSITVIIRDINGINRINVAVCGIVYDMCRYEAKTSTVMVKCSLADNSTIYRFDPSNNISVRLFNSRTVWERRGFWFYIPWIVDWYDDSRLNLFNTV